MSDALTEVLEAHRTYREKLQVLSQDKIQEACREFFQKNPQVLAFAWTQYVPGFNDGDPCYFTLGEPAVCWSREALEQDPESKHYRTGELNVADIWEEDPTEDDIKGFGTGELGYEDSEYNVPHGARIKDEFKAQDDAFSELWSKLASVEDVLESIFGSNAHVIITHNNIVVNDYDCGH